MDRRAAPVGGGVRGPAVRGAPLAGASARPAV